MTSPDLTLRRKDAHLDLCARCQVEPAPRGTLFDEVQLVHCALPELAESDLDLSTTFLGKRLAAPFLVTGMTGGTARGEEVNRAIAAAAEKLGLAFAVGSQRAMLERPETAASFRVREVAPGIPVVGNIGIAQAVRVDPERILKLAQDIGADAIAVHLNAAQELAQPEGDRDFRGALAALERLARALGPKLLVKETGCGISAALCARLAALGVTAIDVSGAGGTSWVQVELLRGGRPGVEPFAAWGIPTAAAVGAARRRVPEATALIASGGIRDGLEAAKALALGADLVGVALPVFRAQQAGDPATALVSLVQGLRMAMLLTGCRTPKDLRRCPRVLGGTLQRWLEALSQ